MSETPVTPALRRNAAKPRPVAETFAPAAARRGAGKPATKKTSLQLDAELYRRIKVLAANEGSYPGELINTAIREFLERQGTAQ